MLVNETSNLNLIGEELNSRSSFPYTDNTTLFPEFNISEYHRNDSNVTDVLVGWKATYKPLMDLLMLLILVIVMLAMGCEITWKTLYDHARKPIALSIGMISQFIVMPLSAYGLIRATGVEGLQATGILIISCCPGGPLSNSFSYFCDGDLSLSVGMTFVSTIMALGMMPLNIWLYGRHFETNNLVIPYGNMATSLISVTLPVLMGMFLKWRCPKLAAITTKLGSYSGVIIMFTCFAIEVILFPNMFNGVVAKVYAMILVMPIVGLSLGYGLASIFKLKKQLRKTIAIECGIQNVPVALTIISLSFPIEEQEGIVLLPCLYGFSMIGGSTIACIVYHFFFKKPKEKEGGENVKEIPLLEENHQGSIAIVLKSTTKDNEKIKNFESMDI